MLKAIKKPTLLLRAQDRLWRSSCPDIWNVDFFVVGRDRCRRFIAIVCPAGIKNLDRLLRDHPREVLTGKRRGFRHIYGLFRSIGPLIGDDELDVAPPAYGSIALKRTDSSQIVRLNTKPVVVKFRYGSINDLGRFKFLQRSCVWALNTSRLELEESLIGCDFARLPCPGFFVFLD